MEIEDYDDSEPLWDPNETAGYMKTTPKHLQDMRIAGTGPPFIKLGHRTVRYVPPLVRKYVRERMFSSTSAETAAAE